MALRGILQSRLLWAVVSNGLRVGGYMLVLPITLRTIPEAEMEIWWLFVAVQALVVQADFGLGPSISRGLAYLLAGASSLKPGAAKDSAGVDPARIGGFIQACHRVYRWVLLVALLVLVPASFFIVPKMGAGTFSRGSFGDTRTPAAVEFIAEVRAGATPAARWLQQELPAAVLAGLTVETWNNKAEWDRLMRDLVKEMNRLAAAGKIDRDGRFDGVPLREETRRLAAATAGSNLTRANRLLIEDAFPGTVVKDATVVDGPERRWMLASWFVFAVGVLLTLSNTRFFNFLNGADHVRLSQQLSMVGMAANLSITAIGLLAGIGFVAMALGSLANGACQAFFGRWAVRRHLSPYLSQGDVQAGRHVFTELWPTAWRYGLISIGGYLIYNSNVFWASAHLGQPEASQFPFTLKLMQTLMVLCGLPIATQLPKLSRWMASGEVDLAWKFFMNRHEIGLAGMILGVGVLWLFGDSLLALIGSKSQLVPGPFLLFMGLIYILDFNHCYFATLVMTRNEVPFVWVATLSGLGICVFGGIGSYLFGLTGLLWALFLVQAAANNWWVPLKAVRIIRDARRKVG